MAKRPTLNTLTNTASPTYLTQLNQNFTNVRNQFDNTLSLDGSTPNAMNADIDLNGNDLINAGSVNTATLRIGGQVVSPSETVVVDSVAVKKEFDTVALLLADTGTYTNYAAGDYFRVVNGGFTYQVASSGASDHHVTTAGGVKLYVQADANGGYNLSAFGATLDGSANDTPILKAAIDALKVAGIIDAPPIITVSKGKTLRLSTACVIDGGSIKLSGYGANLTFAENNALDIGNATYLTDIAQGNYTFILEGFKCVGPAGNNAIRNRGYRKLWVDGVYCLGGGTFLTTEGAFAGSGMRRCRIQSTTGNSVIIKQRNNNWVFENCAITGAGAPAVYLYTSGAELKGIQWVGRNDIEGSAGGILVEGMVSNLGIDGLWFENNTVYNIKIDNAAGSSNKDGISITRSQITGAGVDVIIGTDVAGVFIRGVTIEGNEFSESDLIVIGDNRVRDCRIGANQMNGTSVYTLPTQTSMIADSVSLPVYRTMPLYSTPPAVPFGTDDTKGVLGEIRWEQGELWIKTSQGWVNTQVGQQDDGSLRYLPTGATPSVAGQHKCLTGNSGATSITNFTNGKAGQELVIVGLDGGNTTIVNSANVRLAGGANFTLGDNDVIVLINRNGTVWCEVSRSNNA